MSKEWRRIHGKICAFFGHRDAYSFSREQLRKAIERVIEAGAATFWYGGYGAFDAAAVSVVKELMAENKTIELVKVLAYLPEKQSDLLPNDTATLYPEGLEAVPKRFAIDRRNIWIADHCDFVICCVSRSFGGAYKACHRAQRKGKAVIFIEAQNQEENTSGGHS